MNHLLSGMLAKADPLQVVGLSRFFKTGPGQYGEGDKFLGIKVPVTREVVKACWRQTNFVDIEECIRSEYHEVRLAALLTLVQIFTHARKDVALQQRCVDFYLGHTEFVNNWDLVDLSCYEILGRWLLREAGKRDEDRLRRYLTTNHTRMPRTMLRYAIEKFSPQERCKFLRTRESLASAQTAMRIRVARCGDIPRIMEICGEARDIMRADGNKTQWTGGYPSEDIIRTDIDSSVGFVIEIGGRLEGYFAFIPGVEPTYLEIEGSGWIDDVNPYCTIHRLASTKASRGIARACFEWCWGHCRNLRIDTHRDNSIMRHCIESFGFSYCGVIHLRNGDPRLAYQKSRN